MDYEEHHDYNATYHYDDDVAPVRVIPSSAASIIAISIYAISFATGILGNGTVIWLVGFKWSRSVTSLWFLNLAIADFILVLCLPVEISYVARNYYWLFGLNMCKISSFAYHFGALASVLFLTVISVDRYCMMYRQGFCFKYRFRSYAIGLSIVLWLFSATLASTRAYSKTLQEMVDGIDCIDDFHSDRHTSILLHRIVTSLFLIMGYMIPSILLLSSYRAIKVCNTKPLKKSHECLITILIISFLVCWTPYNVIRFLKVIGLFHHESKFFVNCTTIFVALTFLSSCFNPVIYTMLSERLGLDKDVMLEALKRTIEGEDKEDEGQPPRFVPRDIGYML
ncbi:G protein-coupled receptor-like protein [Fowlpox virus]|nr:G protein-coupled receptor-like protein [Fowlpox virus]